MEEWHDYADLSNYIGAEISFHLGKDDCFIGKLTEYNPDTGEFHFGYVKTVDGSFFGIRTTFTYKDFVGRFRVTKLPENLTNGIKKVHEDKLINEVVDRPATYIVNINQDDVTPIDLIDKNKQTIDTIVVPDSKIINYEQIDYDFNVDPRRLYSKISNTVVSITDASDKNLRKAIEAIETYKIISVAFLPPRPDRKSTIDFILVGCEQVNFLFLGIESILSKLKPVLESNKVTKIIHDCCMPADCLLHTYSIDMQAVEDTLVLDCALISQHFKRKKSFGFQNARSIGMCLKDYCDIEVPWDSIPDYYNRSGRGKLAQNPLDETGKNYVRSLVMLLPELRIKLYIAYNIPLLSRQSSYLHFLKYSSDKEYQELKICDAITPFQLALEDGINVETLNLGTSLVISELLQNRFSLFNQNQAKKKVSVGVQVSLQNSIKAGDSGKNNVETCDKSLSPIIKFKPSYNRVLKQKKSSTSSSTTSIDEADLKDAAISPPKSLNVQNCQNNSKDNKSDQNQCKVQNNVNGYSNHSTNGTTQNGHSNGDSDFTDWSQFFEKPRLGNTKVKFYPAGMNLC